MLKILPLLLAVLYAIGLYLMSAARTRAELTARSAPLQDPDLARHMDRLAAALELPGLRVHLYEIAPVNGLASPDGRVFITRGFYNKYRTGEVTGPEIASVIAHELGHVALGHTRKRLIDFSGQNALRTALAIFFARFAPGVGLMLANTLTSLLAARMSRSDEFEADAYASALMIKAGYGTEPQKSLFRKLGALTRTPSGGAPAWFLSHPVTEARIAAIEANERRWRGTP